MRTSTARALGALVLFLASQTVVCGQLSGLYGWDRATGALYVISPTSAAATLIGSSGLVGLQSLELAADGFLYGVWTDSAAQNATLYRINPATAAPAIVGLLGIGNVFEGGLAFGPTGTAYATNRGSSGSPYLFQVSLTTGAGTLIGLISGGSHDVNGLAWRDDGMLIGLDRVSNSLVLINAATAALTPLAAVSAVVGAAGGMGIRGGLGYFATSGTTGASPGSNELWTFDPMTGSQSLIGSFGPPISSLGLMALSGDCRLEGDVTTVSLSLGGIQTLTIAAPLGANRQYVVAGTTAGTYPGFPFGPLLVPLNVDGPAGYFAFTLNSPNTVPLLGSNGFLDAFGTATAHFLVPPGSPSFLAGITVNHVCAYLDIPGSGAVLGLSNPSSVLLAP
jgi:Repeat of unknown function (DUF6923)